MKPDLNDNRVFADELFRVFWHAIRRGVIFGLMHPLWPLTRRGRRRSHLFVVLGRARRDSRNAEGT